MYLFTISKTGYGYTRGDKVELVAFSVDEAIIELNYIGLQVGRDGLLSLKTK